ncbi:MAG: hypothetical protein IT205_10190 [Fimbriimonadaceae bacterium]|nr:hypothetical protein [Fimbriimonadaceae bacterium]
MKAKILIPIIAVVFALSLAATAPSQGYGHGNGQEMTKTTTSPAAFQMAVRDLFADHMQWTYATVDAFFHNPDALKPTLGRLLQNQKDLGAAIVPFYGKEAGDKVEKLFTEHIMLAVPVLTAAKAKDDAALKKALDGWYANAEEIAVFLSAANPKQWPESATKPMMKEHISTTTVYAVDLLKGDYASAIKHYDSAYDHMMMMADALSSGIIAQFPDKFRK